LVELGFLESLLGRFPEIFLYNASFVRKQDCVLLVVLGLVVFTDVFGRAIGSFGVPCGY